MERDFLAIKELVERIDKVKVGDIIEASNAQTGVKLYARVKLIPKNSFVGRLTPETYVIELINYKKHLASGESMYELKKSLLFEMLAEEFQTEYEENDESVFSEFRIVDEKDITIPNSRIESIHAFFDAPEIVGTFQYLRKLDKRATIMSGYMIIDNETNEQKEGTKSFYKTLKETIKEL